MTKAPVIKTERLVLRGHILADFAPLRAFYDTDRAKYVGAPISDARLWQGFAGDVGSWDLQGLGAWTITLPDGTPIGQVAVQKPAHFPETEIGWMLFAEYEGKGYAYEAALAARDWAHENLDLEVGLVSYVDAENTGSVNLAVKLGATVDPSAATPENDPCLVYRHPLPGGAA